jgi:hypothetical protein
MSGTAPLRLTLAGPTGAEQREEPQACPRSTKADLVACARDLQINPQQSAAANCEAGDMQV